MRKNRLLQNKEFTVHLDHSELGKKSVYEDRYNPKLLFPISRQIKRAEIGIHGEPLPFFGFDQWTHYEVSWLNEQGKPIVAVAELVYACDSPYIIESKSMKLYFNSFNQTKFKDLATVEATIAKDLSQKIEAPVTVEIRLLHDSLESQAYYSFSGTYLDDLDIACDVYSVDANYLTTEPVQAEEVLYSHLLKSNCLVTGQPDWGSVQISYQGNKINHASLLKYIVSFRNHNEFHEQCIERIFADIMTRCKPQQLTVYGRYTRRGGLDINPYRSTNPVVHNQLFTERLYRQ